MYVFPALTSPGCPCARCISHCCTSSKSPALPFVPNPALLPFSGSLFSLSFLASRFSNCCLCGQPVWWQEGITGSEDRQQTCFLLQQLFYQPALRCNSSQWYLTGSCMPVLLSKWVGRNLELTLNKRLCFWPEWKVDSRTQSTALVAFCCFSFSQESRRQ